MLLEYQIHKKISEIHVFSNPENNNKIQHTLVSIESKARPCIAKWANSIGTQLHASIVTGFQSKTSSVSLWHPISSIHINKCLAAVNPTLAAIPGEDVLLVNPRAVCVGSVPFPFDPLL